MKCVYYGMGELRNRAPVQCGHVYIVFLFFFLKKRKAAGILHTPLPFLTCCYSCTAVHLCSKVSYNVALKLWICEEAPLPI